MVKAVINQTGGVRANINSTTSAGPQQVSVQVPSTNLAVTSASSLRNLSDVNASTLEDGALLQYDASSEKFVTKTTIDTNTGTLIFNGGNF